MIKHKCPCCKCVNIYDCFDEILLEEESGINIIVVSCDDCGVLFELDKAEAIRE